MEIKSTQDQVSNGTMHQKFLVYGPPGVGKTYLIRTLDGKPVIASCEAGLTSVADLDLDYVDIGSIDDLRKLYRSLSNSDHDYDWVVLDSVTEIAEMLLSDLKESEKDMRRAYGNMQDSIMRILRKYRSLNMNVYFSAKEAQVDDDGSSMFIPSMPGKQLSQKSPIGHLFDYVFAMRSRQKENGDIERFFQTESSRRYQAKARDPKGVLETYEKPDLSYVRKNLIDSFNQTAESQNTSVKEEKLIDESNDPYKPEGLDLPEELEFLDEDIVLQCATYVTAGNFNSNNLDNKTIGKFRDRFSGDDEEVKEKIHRVFDMAFDKLKNTFLDDGQEAPESLYFGGDNLEGKQESFTFLLDGNPENKLKEFAE